MHVYVVLTLMEGDPNNKDTMLDGEKSDTAVASIREHADLVAGRCDTTVA